MVVDSLDPFDNRQPEKKKSRIRKFIRTILKFIFRD
jgi:hypothetical protein